MTEELIEHQSKIVRTILYSFDITKEKWKCILFTQSYYTLQILLIAQNSAQINLLKSIWMRKE